MNNGFGCLTITLTILFNLIVGTFCVIYTLGLFGITIPLFGSVIIGLILGELVVPIAIVMFIIHLFGAI